MSNSVVYMTGERYAKLEEELNFLRNVKRHEIAERLHEALADGDEPDENVAYESAKMEQAFLEGRILEISRKLARVSIIERNILTDSIQIGNRVVIQENGGEPETYTIVGADEGNPKEGLISYESPLGQALMNHHAGEEIVVNAPDGMITFRILEFN
jgi:transcription elongation factor GreA